MDKIEYKAWKDNGGNIGVQCMFEACTMRPTFWTGKEMVGKVIERIDTNNNIYREEIVDCPNCIAIVKNNLVKIENDKHQNEAPDQACTHSPSQNI